MRDPKRIPLVLDLIKQIWQQEPDLRLGQIIANSIYHNECVFSIEEGILISRLLERFPQQKKQLTKVILESPYAGNIEENVKYARECMNDSFLRGEAPLASHLLYTQEGILDDNKPNERALGIEAGLLWGKDAEKTVVYVDKGFSKGMIMGMERAVKEKRPIEIRSIYP